MCVRVRAGFGAELRRHMIREAAYYTKMALGLAAWVRSPVLPDPFGVVQRTLLDREANFLGLIRSAIFGNPASPYFGLMAWAGCSYDDVQAMVRRDGLEQALQALYESGVYL